jgi:hypothetical protein
LRERKVSGAESRSKRRQASGVQIDETVLKRRIVKVSKGLLATGNGGVIQFR